MRLLCSTLAILWLVGVGLSPGFLTAAPSPVPGAAVAAQLQRLRPVQRWNTLAVDASGRDHAGLGEQLGPGRASRAMAMVHLAMADAAFALAGGHETYGGVSADRWPAAVVVAVAQAAHDTLADLYPSQRAAFAAELQRDLSREPNRVARAHGITLGRRAAAAILTLRTHDGSELPEPRLGAGHWTSHLPGRWRMDPISQHPLALGAKWGKCLPFVLEAPDLFRVPAPPDLGSAAYAAAYEEVRRLGGDGVRTPTWRTPEQGWVGVFWAYDGSPSLCAPTRLYNQIARAIAARRNTGELQLARLLALVNVAMADSGMACWDSKWHWDFWRPITGIRESDPGTGPTGWGDGNPATVGDPGFHPLGAPASNLNAPNFTPPFPSYPSGHAAFGSALFQVLRRFYGTDAIPFTFVSDEFNGVTRGPDGRVRPYLPRSYRTLAEAEEENGQSRIYLGIHWSFDKTAGMTLGRQVGDHVVERLYLPVPPRVR